MPDSPNREREIFTQALECNTTPEREAYLAAACAGDPALRNRVEMLLRAHAEAGGFLGTEERAESTTQFAADDVDAPGSRIGRYRLVEKLGEGGFGTVYAAEQEEPVRRKVALKIIKLGMDTRAVIARFEAERQALALMDHPGIAKVFDAGATPTGRPFFVMELVQGEPITAFCNSHRLDPRERIELFMQICHAVQHAHQKGLIHRDLKPSNILITRQDGRPVPKVIDFGIAKATEQRLTEKTLFSRMHPFIGTPAYMSPEQAGTGGVDVDTRSDVYSLGVLLYELLTDKTPFDTKALLEAGYAEIQRTILEQDPPVPSHRLATLSRDEQTTAAQRRSLEPAKLTSQLRGDLDRIVMKCLEKDRARRYPTTAELAADLGRHLKHEPVLARPASLGYRIRKFTRRHRTAVMGTAVAILVLSALGVFHTVRLTIERDRARLEAEKARRLTALLTDLLTASDPYRTREAQEPTVRSLLDSGAERIRRELADEPELQAEMLTILGRVYQRLGLPGTARPLLEDALKLHPRRSPGTAGRAQTLNDLGVLLAQEGKYPQAEALLVEALDLRRALFGRDRNEFAITLVELGRVHADRGANDRAEPLFREALEIRRRVLGPEHRETATSLSDLGLLLWETGRPEEAEPLLRECVEVSRRSLGPAHPDVGTSLANHALVVLDRGDYARAEMLFREAFETRRKGLGEAHPNLAATLNNLGHALREQGKYDEAESVYRQAIEIAERAYGKEHPAVATYTINLGRVYLARGEAARAEAYVRSGLAVRERVFSAQDWRVASPQSLLGGVLIELGRFSDAEPLLLRASQVLKDVPGPQAREAQATRERLARLHELTRRATLPPGERHAPAE